MQPGSQQVSFKAKTRSGTAVITATIASDDNGIPHTTVLTIPQKIDHNLPQTAIFDNLPVMTVGTVSNLNITLKDRYGNLIDNLGPNPAAHHTFSIYMPGERAGILGRIKLYCDKTVGNR